MTQEAGPQVIGGAKRTSYWVTWKGTWVGPSLEMHQPLFVEMHKRLNQQPGLSHATMIVMGEKIMFAAVVKAADDRDALAVASGASDDVARHLDKVVRTAGWDQWHWPEPAE